MNALDSLVVGIAGKADVVYDNSGLSIRWGARLENDSVKRIMDQLRGLVFVEAMASNQNSFIVSPPAKPREVAIALGQCLKDCGLEVRVYAFKVSKDDAIVSELV